MMASRLGSSKHRPGFHALVLAIGFVTGGLLTKILRVYLPTGAVKEFLTMGVTPQVGAVNINLIIVNFAIGPVALDVSLMAVVGVLAAYLIARSLF